MRIDLLKGTDKRVFAWGESDGKCEVKDFLAALMLDGNPDAAQLVKRLQSLADGARLREEQGHPLEDGFYVLKTSGMTRLIWFYDPTERAVIICTHCFRKPAGERYAGEQKRAAAIRERYKAERESIQEAEAKAASPKFQGNASKNTKRKK